MKHEHQHLPTSLKHVRSTEDGMVTIVLLHCKCGDFTHARIPGEWTWEEIAKNKMARPVNDRSFLKSVGIAVKVGRQ